MTTEELLELFYRLERIKINNKEKNMPRNFNFLCLVFGVTKRYTLDVTKLLSMANRFTV